MTRRSAILTTLLLSLPLAGMIGVTASASAQTSGTATIPFAFAADHVNVPAGTYKVQRVTNSLVSLSNVETGKTQFLAVHPEGGRIIESQGHLTFHRDGISYSLIHVAFAGTSIQSGLTAPPSLRTEAKNLAGPTLEVAVK